jgi:hypothetical protein
MVKYAHEPENGTKSAKVCGGSSEKALLQSPLALLDIINQGS